MKPINKKEKITNKNIYFESQTAPEKIVYYKNIINDKNFSKHEENDESKTYIFNNDKNHNFHKYKNNFISISDFQENEEQILDNNNYKFII